MNTVTFFCIVSMLFLALPVFGKLEVALTDAAWSDGKASLSLEAKNSGGGSISGARVWVFLMNDAGKVVGNHAEWIIGGKRAEENPEPGKGANYEVTFQSKESFTSARVTFSKLLGANKEPLNPRKMSAVTDKTKR